MKIQISDIAILGRQRKSMDPVKVAELAESIKTNGLIQPIVVRKPQESELSLAAGKPYVLSVGGRRTAAHMFLGILEIEALLKEDILDPIQAKIVELEENIRRENLTWQEEVDAQAELAEILMSRTVVDRSRGMSSIAGQVNVAEQMGVSIAKLSRDMNLHKQMKANPGLRLAASKGSAMRRVQFEKELDTRLATAEANQGSTVTELRKKLITEDARTYAARIPSQSVDLVFTDLPYGKDHFATQNSTEVAQGFYDDSQQPVMDFIQAIVPECLRIVKPSGWVVFFMCYELHEWLQKLSSRACIEHGEYELGNTRKCPGRVGVQSKMPCHFLSPEMPPWIWTRRGKGNNGHWPELHASNRYEMLVVVNGGSAKLAKKPVENVLDYPPFSAERFHAMQKPHDLCRDIIERTTVTGELVLDLCFGSGAQLAAAASLNRDFMGCDLNPDNLKSALALVGQYYNAEQAKVIAKARGTT